MWMIILGDSMLVRLGYVAISTAIDVTSSSPYTYSEYLNKCNIDKLDDIIKSNLLGLEEILKYNVKLNLNELIMNENELKSFQEMNILLKLIMVFELLSFRL